MYNSNSLHVFTTGFAIANFVCLHLSVKSKSLHPVYLVPVFVRIFVGFNYL